MNPLLAYLVARSVPDRPGAAPAGREGAGPPAESPLAGQPAGQPGAVRPRLPGRYERLPGLEPWPETLLFVELEEEGAPRPGPVRPTARQGPAVGPGEGQDLAPGPEGPERPRRQTPKPPGQAIPNRPAEPRVARSEGRETRKAGQTPAPAEEAGPAPVRAQPESEARPAAEPAPASRAAEPPVQARPARVEPQVRPRSAPPVEGEGPPAEAPAPRALWPEAVVPAVRPRGQEAALEEVGQEPVARGGGSAPQGRPIRAGVPRPVAEPPPPPRIQVHIGRIEVRAVYAPPPAPAPPSRPGPVMSLDDYLKQRDGGS